MPNGIGHYPTNYSSALNLTRAIYRRQAMPKLLKLNEVLSTRRESQRGTGVDDDGSQLLLATQQRALLGGGTKILGGPFGMLNDGTAHSTADEAMPGTTYSKESMIAATATPSGTRRTVTRLDRVEVDSDLRLVGVKIIGELVRALHLDLGGRSEVAAR